jgi:hypothetical protein
MTIIGKASLVLVLGFGLLAAHPCAAQEPQSDSLQITLVQVQAVAGQPRFRVELHNAGDRALILNLGMMLANGKRQYCGCNPPVAHRCSGQDPALGTHGACICRRPD